MGNSNNKPNPKKDRQALVEFLNGKSNLDKIWKRFDKDGNVECDFYLITIALLVLIALSVIIATFCDCLAFSHDQTIFRETFLNVKCAASAV